MAVDAKATILVVEDEQIVALDISNALNALGYSVPTVASSGAEALARAEELRPGLVLMDVRIEGEMDGIATAAAIRERFDIPVVFLTAYADDDSLRRAKESSPFGYLLKPFNRRELRTAIEVGLYRHEIESKLAERERWLSTILSSIGDAVIALDPEERVAFMNPAAERMTGVARNKAPGAFLRELLKLPREGDLPTVLTAGHNLKVVAPASQRGELHVDGSASPITFDDGRDGTVVVLRDITERRDAEERLRRSQEGFRETVEALNDCVAVLRGQTIVYVNAAFHRCLGFLSAADMVGRPFASFLHFDERAEVEARLATGLEAAEHRFVGPAGIMTLECGRSKNIEFEGQPATLIAADRKSVV
jgi:PAS domain S-box-containing protein